MQVEKWALVLRKGRSEEVLGKLVGCGAGAVGGLLGALRMGAALAGNVGTGGAFALCARGGKGVDVPMLASPRPAAAGPLFRACPLCGPTPPHGNAVTFSYTVPCQHRTRSFTG